MTSPFHLEPVGRSTIRIIPRDPFRLSPTVTCHGWYQTPPFQWNGGVLSRIDRGPNGKPFLWSVREEQENVRGAKGRLLVRAKVSGRGARVTEKLLDHAVQLAVRCLNLDWDLRSFYKMARKYDGLKKAPKLGAGRILRAPTAWEDISKSLCGTNIQWTQAVRIIERLAELGTVFPDAFDRKCWPTPKQILAAGDGHLREICRMGYRAPYLIGIARQFIERADLTETFAVPDEQGCFQAFRAMPGIGPSTASYLINLHGHLDRMVVDSAVRAYVRRRFGEQPERTDDQIRALFDDYAPYRGLGYWMDWAFDSGWVGS